MTQKAKLQTDVTGRFLDGSHATSRGVRPADRAVAQLKLVSGH